MRKLVPGLLKSPDPREISTIGVVFPRDVNRRNPSVVSPLETQAAFVMANKLSKRKVVSPNEKNLCHDMWQR